MAYYMRNNLGIFEINMRSSYLDLFIAQCVVHNLVALQICLNDPSFWIHSTDVLRFVVALI